MIIDCISDLHGHYPKLEGGDLLIVAGDLTARDTGAQWGEFSHWIHSKIGPDKHKYRKAIIIAGNHDNSLTFNHECVTFDPDPNNAVAYLCDSGTEFHYFDDRFPQEDEKFLPSGHRTLKIWGSPWTKTFEGMNPHCKAFTYDDEEEVAGKWEAIPTDVDILITHAPPFTIGDLTVEGAQVGSVGLMTQFITRLKPKLWVFGHIHEAYGQFGMNWARTILVNASHVNENYKPVNPPVRIVL